MLPDKPLNYYNPDMVQEPGELYASPSPDNLPLSAYLKLLQDRISGLENKIENCQ
jgi:hypothetical protein